MAGLDIDVAGEYLLMAATLCHIKSRELLPTPEPLEDEDARTREAARRPRSIRAPTSSAACSSTRSTRKRRTQLGQRPVVGRNVWSRGAPTEDAVGEGVDPDAIAPLAPFPVHKLIEAFDRVMRQAKVKVAHNVLIDRLSVSQKICRADRPPRERRPVRVHLDVLRSCATASRGRLEEIRHEAVVTFLALLEMAKLRLIALVASAEDDEEIFIERAGDDLRARDGARRRRGTDDYR